MGQEWGQCGMLYSLVGKDFTLTLALSLKGEGISGLTVGHRLR